MSETQQAQTRPQQGGMRRIPFPLESYEHPSLPLSAKRLINLMAEQAPDDARTARALVSTPALQQHIYLPPGPIIAMNDEFPAMLYVVSGTTFYRVSLPVGASSFLIENLGDIGTPDGTYGPYTFITIAAGPEAAVVCVPPRAYTCGHFGPLNQITSENFPGAASVAYCDGYFAYSSFGGTARWFISKLFDPLNFDALDFVYSDATPNIIRRVYNHRGQLWTVGDGGFEVFYDSGGSDFPFSRASGGVIYYGTNAPMTVCRADKSVWWVGVEGVVYRSNGYNPQRVSTHAIEAIIGGSAYGISALTHPYRGHWFYCITTATGRTLCYDIATGVWHERSTSLDGVGPWQAATAAADNNSIHWYGDRASGWIYTLQMASLDAGVPVMRQATLPVLWAETRRAFCSRLEIEMEVGGDVSSGPVQLEWSDDGARTWIASRSLDVGVSDTRHRVYTTRLGSFRQRNFRLTTRALTRFYAVDAEIAAGAH
jgi:hypothetical protein